MWISASRISGEDVYRKHARSISLVLLRHREQKTRESSGVFERMRRTLRVSVGLPKVEVSLEARSILSLAQHCRDAVETLSEDEDAAP